MRIFKSKLFVRFARRQDISDGDLCEAIERAERGLIDADLGGNVIKQRIARPNEGRSGGFRTLIFFRVQDRAFFVYGFAKNEQGNISSANLRAFKLLAKTYLGHTDDEIQQLVELEELIEVICNEEEI